MAKSLRSKTKRAARTIKRKLIFAPVEEERLQRLAKKQSIDSSNETIDYTIDTTGATIEKIENVALGNDMMMEVVLSKNEIKRLAMSRHQVYKKNKAKKRIY